MTPTLCCICNKPRQPGSYRVISSHGVIKGFIDVECFKKMVELSTHIATLIEETQNEHKHKAR